MGKKTNRRGPSFSYKIRYVRVVIELSRDRRPARWTGSTVAPARREVENETCLENSLGMSKAGARGSRGIPTEGGSKPLDSIERDQ